MTQDIGIQIFLQECKIALQGFLLNMRFLVLIDIKLTPVFTIQNIKEYSIINKDRDLFA